MQQIKERLFGITVLVSLAVIFVPMLLTGNHEHKLNLTQSIPQEPEDKSLTLAANQPKGFKALDKKAKLQPIIVEEQTVQDTSSKTEPKISSVTKTTTSKPSQSNNIEKVASKPKAYSSATLSMENAKSKSTAQVSASHRAWVVQLATFGNPKNAQNLVNKLKKDGFPAYSKSSQVKNKEFTLVLVGPKAKKDDAQKLTNVLQDKYKLRGVVIQHQPAAS